MKYKLMTVALLLSAANFFVYGSDFLIGWYSNMDFEYLKVLTGVSPNHYKMTDPYSKYYNIFLNYSVFNTENDLSESDLKKFVPVLNIDDSLLSGKHFIVDLPRYSALFRPLFSFLKQEKSPDTSLFSTSIIYNDSIVYPDKSFLDKYIKTDRNKTYPVYSFLSSAYTGDNYLFTKFDFNEKKIFDPARNAVVYSFADMIGFSYKTDFFSSSFIVELYIKDNNGFQTLYIFSDTNSYNKAESADILKKNRICISLDGFFEKSSKLKEKISLSELYSEGVIYSDPGNQEKTDTLWKSFEIDIRKLLKSYFNMKLIQIKDIAIYSNRTEIADMVFAYNNDYSLKQMKSVVSRIAKMNKKSVLGFYTGDEIERSEVFYHDRWMHIYNADKENTDRINKNSKQTMKYLQGEIRKYIKESKHIPFTLSTIHFYTEKGRELEKFDSTYTMFTDSFIFYDDYSYSNAFISNFMKIGKIADSLNCKILYAGDAYSTKTKSAMGFTKMKWRFFAPLIMGADGMLFYSYFSPKITNFSQLLSDTNKMNIGFFSKFVTESGIRDNLSSDRTIYTVKMADGRERISTMAADKTGNVFFIFLIQSQKSFSDKFPNISEFAFTDNDSDITALKKLLLGEKHYAFDISPYMSLSDSINGITDDDKCFFINSGVFTDSSSLLLNMNSGIFNSMLSDFDIRIIKFALHSEPKIEIAYDSNVLAVSVLNPQLLKNGRLSVICKDSLGIKIRKSFSLINLMQFENKIKLLTVHSKIRINYYNEFTDCKISYTDIWGGRHIIDFDFNL